MDADWDCIVVGGGAAGLSAALVLGRAQRRTLVVDGGEQSNLPAHGIGGLVGHDGRPPAEFYALAREELGKYPSVEVRAGEVEDGERSDGGFTLSLVGGTTERARRVLLATGMDYRHRDLPGVRERWGGTVFHCPFCHGWEVHGRRLGVLGDGAHGVEQAVLLTAWSDDVTLLTDGAAVLEPAEAELLRGAGVEVDERPVAGLEGEGSELEAVRFGDGSVRPLGGLLLAIQLHQRSGLARALGVAAAQPSQMAEDAIEVDAMSQTSIPGLYAAGDTGGKMPSVANAIAGGSVAAAIIVRDLMLDAAGNR